MDLLLHLSLEVVPPSGADVGGARGNSFFAKLERLERKTSLAPPAAGSDLEAFQRKVGIAKNSIFMKKIEETELEAACDVKDNISDDGLSESGKD